MLLKSARILMKRVKTSRRKDDRISALPDNILCQILSLLPFETAARTSVLSKRWKDLFTSVPIIDLEEKENAGNFIAFVYRVLHLIVLKLSHIRRFRINFSAIEHTMKAIASSWISTVVSCNVHELILLGFFDVWPTPLPPLPLPLFSCKSLMTLKLGVKFVINVPEYVSLPLLKTLCLRYVVFCVDDSVRRLLSGAPVLEDFILYSCDMTRIEVFAVFSPSLKRFEIYKCDGDYELSVKAPNLKHLNSNSLALRGCSGEAFKYPLEACIVIDSIDNFGDDDDLDRYFDRYFGKMHEFVDKVCNARKLLLHGDVMLGVVRTQYQWPNFYALTYLDLLAQEEDGEGWTSLPGLLESSPCLETLILWGFWNEDGQFPMSCVPICFSMNLKTIHLNWFNGSDTELIMVEYILANAKVLEKLIICSDPQCDEIVDWVREEVSAFQTYSKACQINVTALECKEDFQLCSTFDLSAF